LFAQNLHLINILYYDDFQHVLFEVYSILFVQPDRDVGTPEFDYGSLPTNISDFGVPYVHHSSCRCAEHLSRIADLEGRLSLVKRQAKTAMDQAGKSFGLLKKVSSLESQLSNLMAKVAHLDECDAFLIEIIESACKQLQCKLSEAPKCFLLLHLVLHIF
jgi:hypothetical protein